MRNLAVLAFILVCVPLALVCYWPGLDGPFLFDDHANLMPLRSWLDGDTSWQQIVFGNQSGLLGRPVSMAAFLFTAMIGGLDPFTFKLHNLAIHLTTGIAIFFLFDAIARLDPILKSAPVHLAAALTAIWLLHPFLASTVLYSVQRIAMLSALFTILTMLAYIYGRVALERDRAGSAVLWLFVAVPASALLAVFSKENGALALPLCAILELIYFGNRPHRRHTAAQIFVLIGLGLPVTIAIAILLSSPDFYFAGYDNRPFTAWERILTQSRVLFDYISSILLPIGSKFSLYRDDYPLSTGIFSPFTTLLSLVGLLGIAFTIVIVRRTIPGFSAGMAIFLVGHSIESSIFPLLIYFEHRNYLPSVGLLLAVASLVIFLFSRIHLNVSRPRLLLHMAVIGLVAVLSFATLGRANIWASHDLLIKQTLDSYPDSRWARMEMANLEMNRTVPNISAARSHYEHLQNLEKPSTRLIGKLGIIAVNCYSEKRTDSSQVAEAFSIIPEALEPDVEKAISSLASILQAQPCSGLTQKQLADFISDWLDRVRLDESIKTKWRLRYLAARTYLHNGFTDDALGQALIAWDSGAAEAPVGMLIAGLLINQGNYARADDLLDEVAKEIPQTDFVGNELLRQYKEKIDHQKRLP